MPRLQVSMQGAGNLFANNPQLARLHQGQGMPGWRGGTPQGQGVDWATQGLFRMQGGQPQMSQQLPALPQMSQQMGLPQQLSQQQQQMMMHQHMLRQQQQVGTLLCFSTINRSLSRAMSLPL